MFQTNYKKESIDLGLELQSQISAAIIQSDRSSQLVEDKWKREDSSGIVDGGGGCSRIFRGGEVFEQAGINFSEVYGTLPAEMTKRLTGSEQESKFFATGVSLVFHPISPLVPTVHANFRYLEVEHKAWFGGGADLTPYYLFQADAIHFHSVLKQACETTKPGSYEDFKKNCDEYFYIQHRGETRGIGGVFYDYIGKDSAEDRNFGLELNQNLGRAFVESYFPIVEQRKSAKWTEDQRQFQLWRRGRYVEFNLVYDRGTLFGLKTNGRIESILMSLPPQANWSYDYKPEANSSEAKLLEVLKNPRDWV